MTGKITVDELFDLYGSTLPPDAVSILVNSPPETPLSEVREKLTVLGKEWKAKTMAAREFVDAIDAIDQQLAQFVVDELGRGETLESLKDRIRNAMAVIDGDTPA